MTEQSSAGAKSDTRNKREDCGAPAGNVALSSPMRLLGAEEPPVGVEPRYLNDLQIATRASAGDSVAQLEVAKRIEALPIRPMRAPLAGVRIEPEEVRSEMRLRLHNRHGWLASYRGDAPLNGYMLRGAIQIQLGLRRTHERRAAILRRLVDMDPCFQIRFKGVEREHDEIVRSSNDVLIRELVYGELYDGYFERIGRGAPIQMPTACEHGFLEAVWTIGDMHIEMLSSLKSGIDTRAACAKLRGQARFSNFDTIPKLIDVYEENDGVTQLLVEYGVECIIDVMDAIEFQQVRSSSNWTRRHRTTLTSLGHCRKRLGESLWRSAA